MRVCTSCKLVLKADATQCPADGAPAEVVETLPKDTRLGKYRIDRVLGEGGMGFVYEATHQELNRRSAIKMLRPELATHPQIVTRFLNEAKAVNLIAHQNVVDIYDYSESSDGNVYFVMDFLEGETLDDLMRKRRPMQLPLLLHVFGQVAKALAAAHAKQIVHRDLKPANVFVVAHEDNPYFIKLLDFGIAQLRGAGAVEGLTLAGQVMGTPQYMSPEQISGGTVDARADVWAMGVMLYRAATGHAPFKGEQFAELADKILHHPPPPAGELVAMPAALAALIASCLERDVEQRCASMAALIAGLDRVKQACGLDEDAILEAVQADSGALGEAVPTLTGGRTRGSIGGSDLKRQVPSAVIREIKAGAAPRPARSRLGMYLAIAAAVGGLAGAALFVVGRTGTTRGAEEPPGPVGSGRAPAPARPTIKQAFATGGIDAARPLAEQDLRAQLAADSLQPQGLAADALARARVPAAAPLLYVALKGPPDVRVKAARALGELGLPESAPKLRAALAEAAEKVKVELASPLYRLGDKDARAILLRAIEQPSTKLTAALAMAAAGDDGGTPVLAEVLEVMPAGSDQWRRAAGGLLGLGDANARTLLEGELAQHDASRAIGAAELLARAGDARARDQLARAMADTELPRRGEAARALGRLGDKRALGWVTEGFASPDLDERRLALEVCGALASEAKAHAGAIAALATDDVDLSVRMTAEAVLLGL